MDEAAYALWPLVALRTAHAQRPRLLTPAVPAPVPGRHPVPPHPSSVRRSP